MSQGNKFVIFKERIRSCDFNLAKIVGNNEALLFHGLAFHMNAKIVNNIKTDKAGYYYNTFWVYDTFETLAETYALGHRKVAERVVNNLIDKGFLIKTPINLSKGYATNFYTITPKLLEIKESSYTGNDLWMFLEQNKAMLEELVVNINKNNKERTKKRKEALKNNKKKESLPEFVHKENNNEHVALKTPMGLEQFGQYNTNISNTNKSKEDNNINIIEQAKASSEVNKNLDVDLGINNNPNSLIKEKEIPNLNNKEENNPSVDIPREENREEYTEPKIENKDPHFLPIEYDIQYPNKVDLVTKKVSPRYSEAQYQTTVVYLQKWAESKGTKHKILPYGDISNKSFIKALEAVSYYSTDILEFFKNNTWDSKWLKATNITEETLKQAIQLRGGDFEAFKYACGQQCFLFKEGLTHLDHRTISKSFNDFIKTTYKDGKSMSWLLYHIVNDSQVVTIQKDYFWNTVENLFNKFIYEEAQKDIKKFFPTEQNHQKVIDWINYLHEFTISLWKLKPSTRYSTFDKDINKLIGGMHTMLTINNNFKERLPKHYTFGKYDRQVELLDKIRRYGLDDFSDKVLECIQDGSINKLPRYQY